MSTVGPQCRGLERVVGWGRQLDGASQSAHAIVNTTLEQEVQTVSRHLHEIVVVKLDGKALGIVWRGRRAGGMASIETGTRGQVWKHTSSVVEGI